MAQLTWRNVDAPNFGDVNNAMANAGQALNAGFAASRQAIDGFEADQTTAESARMLAATAGVKDPAALTALIGQFNPAYLSQDALNKALARPGDNASVNNTNATAANTGAQTSRFVQMTPGVLTGQSIQNATSAESLIQTSLDNKNKNAAYDAQPVLQGFNAQIASLNAAGTPEAKASISAIQQSPEYIKAATAARQDPGALITASGDAFNKGMAVNATTAAGSDAIRSRAVADQASAELQGYIEGTANPAQAKERVLASNNSPELKAKLNEQIDKYAALWKPVDARGLEIGFGEDSAAGGKTAAPARSSHKLGQDALEEAGLEITSGMRGANDPLTRANPNSAHSDRSRGAWDIRAKTPADADAAIGKTRATFAAKGLQEGRDYKIIDEVRNPSGHATGPHVHVELTSEGNRRMGGGTTGPGGNAASDRASAALASVTAPAANAGPVVSKTALGAIDFNADTVSGVLDNSRQIDAALKTYTDIAQTDDAFNKTRAITKVFSEKDDGASSVAVAKQLTKDAGDGVEGTFWSSSGFTEQTLLTAINQVSSTYKVSPRVAAGLIANSADTKNQWFNKDKRVVDINLLTKSLDQFIDRDTGKVKTEVQANQRGKDNLLAKISTSQSALAKANEEYVAARSSGVDASPQLAKLRQQQKFVAKEIEAFSKSPALTVNTKPLGTP